MQIVKPRKHLRRALALLLVWLCGLLFAAHAHAEEPQPVTVDFVASFNSSDSRRLRFDHCRCKATKPRLESGSRRGCVVFA